MSTSLIEQLQQRTALIAVLGLGYTGWPLANALSEHFEVIGYDPNEQRVSDLLNGVDRRAKASTPRKALPPCISTQLLACYIRPAVT